MVHLFGSQFPSATGSNAPSLPLPAVVIELGELFADAGHELSLVGGPVRDLFLGRDLPGPRFHHRRRSGRHHRRRQKMGGHVLGDRPRLRHHRHAQGPAHDRGDHLPGGGLRPGFPQARGGVRNVLEDDLFRRDFTMNAMALRLPSLELVDPYGGVKDLHAGLLRTPGAPSSSFSDDPLRMMRAARFASQLGVTVAPEVSAAMKDMAGRIEIISAERVRDELVKLVNGKDPRTGVDLLVDTGLADCAARSCRAAAGDR